MKFNNWSIIDCMRIRIIVIGAPFCFSWATQYLKVNGLPTSTVWSSTPPSLYCSSDMRLKGPSELCMLLERHYHLLTSIYSLDIPFHFNTISINILTLFTATQTDNHKISSSNLFFSSCMQILIRLFQAHFLSHFFWVFEIFSLYLLIGIHQQNHVFPTLLYILALKETSLSPKDTDYPVASEVVLYNTKFV